MLTDAQLEMLLALPATEPDLIRHRTLTAAPPRSSAIQRRRTTAPGFFRLSSAPSGHPGRLSRPGKSSSRAWSAA